jgi:hypothetical protein
MMQAIAVLDYDWTPPVPQVRAPRPQPSQESVGQLLNQAGFEVDQVKELEYEESPDALRAWLSVPISPSVLFADCPTVTGWPSWTRLASTSARVSLQSPGG